MPLAWRLTELSIVVPSIHAMGALSGYVAATLYMPLRTNNTTRAPTMTARPTSSPIHRSILRAVIYFFSLVGGVLCGAVKALLRNLPALCALVSTPLTKVDLDLSAGLALALGFF